jgi:hypothetical protein
MITSRRMRWAEYVAHMMAKMNTYRILVGNAEEIRQLGKFILSWEDNIKMDLGEIRWGVWTGLIWLRIGAIGGL